jgi:hypothetical protein
VDIANLTVHDIGKLGQREFKAALTGLLNVHETDRRENSILYYKPVSDYAKQVHLSEAKTIGVGGGNGSSKTETCIVEMIMCATGQIPLSLQGDAGMAQKLRGPIQCRVVCESLTTVLHPIILPKLQWWKWTGVDQPGGEKGHWGWVPRDCLIGGSWDKSWREKYRTLTVLYRDPKQDNRVVGESTIQFMSRDQDASDFASGDFHMILHDEPPTHAIWRENQARTMRVNGRMFLAMTWPDDPSIPVDWLFDEVYEPATGANKDENIDWFNLFTTDNPYLNQDAISVQASQWSDEVRQVRIFGQPIRFSNRIHQLFTDQTRTWCFPCGRSITPVDGKCSRCESSTLTEFNHVADCDPQPAWPTAWLLDPHIRKPHMFSWWQVSPQDDLFQIAEGECADDPTEVAKMCAEMEESMGIKVTHRYIDPNMGRTPSGKDRDVTWQDEFEAAGLVCDTAKRLKSDVGIKRINEYLKPDPHTLMPRIHISRRCPKTIQQMKRYVWDDYRKTLEKDLKQKPKEKNDDFPTLIRYFIMSEDDGPTFNFMSLGAPFIRRMKQRPAQPKHHARLR